MKKKNPPIEDRPHRVCLDFATLQEAIDWFHANASDLASCRLGLFRIDGIDRSSQVISPARTLIVRRRDDRDYGLVAEGGGQ